MTPHDQMYLVQREIRDRSLPHNLRDEAQLAPNTIASISTKSGLMIDLISKARPYSATPYDIMILLHNDKVGDITKHPASLLLEFFQFTQTVQEAMQAISSLGIGVGLNQHPIGPTLSYRSKSGQKNRVQTLLPLHVHVYEIETGQKNSIRWNQLSDTEQEDIYDPLLPLSTTILYQSLQDEKDLADQEAIFTLNHTKPPFGLLIDFEKPFNDFLTQHISLLPVIQRHFNHRYARYAKYFGSLQSDGSYRELTADQARANLIAAMDELSQNPQHQMTTSLFRRYFLSQSGSLSSYRFVNGPAITYTVMPGGNNQTQINIHPRIASRGNSPESLGIYKKTSGTETFDDVQQKIKFYRLLIAKLKSSYTITSGRFLVERMNLLQK